MVKLGFAASAPGITGAIDDVEIFKDLLARGRLAGIENPAELINDCFLMSVANGAPAQWMSYHQLLVAEDALPSTVSDEDSLPVELRSGAAPPCAQKKPRSRNL